MRDCASTLIGWQGEEPVGPRRVQAAAKPQLDQRPILGAEGTEIGVDTHGQGLPLCP